MSYDWREITKQHGPLVWNAVYRILPSHSESLDCYQDVMLEAFEQSAINEIKNWPALRSESTRNPGSVIAAYGKPERETEETVHYIRLGWLFWVLEGEVVGFEVQEPTPDQIEIIVNEDGSYTTTVKSEDE